MATPIPFSPTRALAIHLPSPGVVHEPSKLQDLTPILPILYSSHLGITDENLLSAHKAAIVSPPPITRYGLETQNMAGTHLVILDVEGNQAAEWKEPVLNFSGGATARFPSEKEEGDGGKEEKFVKGGVTFSWAIVDGFVHQRALFKVRSLSFMGQRSLLICFEVR
jgi:hypothetical protein